MAVPQRLGHRRVVVVRHHRDGVARLELHHAAGGAHVKFHVQHAPRLPPRLAVVSLLRREPTRRHHRRQQRLLGAATQPIGLLLLLLLRRRHAGGQWFGGRRRRHPLGPSPWALAEADVEILQRLPQLLPPRVEEGLEALDLICVAPLEPATAARGRAEPGRYSALP